MTIRKRELYRTANGDAWFLAREVETESAFVRHEANPSSGARVTDIDIGAFLSARQRHPHHEALLRLIGPMVERNPRAAPKWVRQR